MPDEPIFACRTANAALVYSASRTGERFLFRLEALTLVSRRSYESKKALDKRGGRQYNIVCFRAVPDDIELVLIRMRVHPFPFRTR